VVVLLQRTAPRYGSAGRGKVKRLLVEEKFKIRKASFFDKKTLVTRIRSTTAGLRQYRIAPYFLIDLLYVDFQHTARLIHKICIHEKLTDFFMNTNFMHRFLTCPTGVGVRV
jgi:hypothetical protein